MRKAKAIEKYLDKVLLVEECLEYLQCSESSFYRWLRKYREK
jgi:predicted DNA-binding transcriptional regulator AlpA